MNISGQQIQLESRMRNARTLVGIIMIFGWIFLFLGTILEGYSGDSFLWVLVLLDGSMFWLFMGRFLTTPSQAELKTLSTIFISFVIVWIIAVAITYFLWGELYVDTLLAIILVLVTTFYMNQFKSDSKIYLDYLNQSKTGET